MLQSLVNLLGCHCLGRLLMRRVSPPKAQENTRSVGVGTPAEEARKTPTVSEEFKLPVAKLARKRVE